MNFENNRGVSDNTLYQQKEIEKVFNKYSYIVKDSADMYYKEYVKLVNELYDKNSDFQYLDNDFKYPNNIVNLEDVEQDYTLYLLQVLNHYYKSNYQYDYIITYICRRFSYYNGKKLKELYNNFGLEVSIDNANNLSYDIISNYLEKVEINELIDQIQAIMQPGAKELIGLLRQEKMNCVQAAKKLNIPRSTAANYLKQAKTKSLKKNLV